MSKYANAEWQGAKEGTGKISTETGALKNAPFTFATRFGDSKEGTNPEELVAAAHAGCFSMKFAIVLGDAGFPAPRRGVPRPDVPRRGGAQDRRAQAHEGRPLAGRRGRGSSRFCLRRLRACRAIRSSCPAGTGRCGR